MLTLFGAQETSGNAGRPIWEEGCKVYLQSGLLKTFAMCANFVCSQYWIMYHYLKHINLMYQTHTNICILHIYICIHILIFLYSN